MVVHFNRVAATLHNLYDAFCVFYENGVHTFRSPGVANIPFYVIYGSSVCICLCKVGVHINPGSLLVHI